MLLTAYWYAQAVLLFHFQDHRARENEYHKCTAVWHLKEVEVHHWVQTLSPDFILQESSRCLTPSDDYVKKQSVSYFLFCWTSVLK
jgi:hypothetical protein